MQTSDVLNKAADLIQKRGWVTGPKGMRVGADSPLCMEGGILAALGSTTVFDSAYTDGMAYSRLPFTTCPAYRAVWDYLRDDSRWGTFRHQVYDWNDTPGRTAAEVIEVLRAAALVESAREDAALLAEVGRA